LKDPEKMKMLAKEHLLASDRYLKKNLFDSARQEIQDAKKVDPANPYISACEDRLRLFEEAYVGQSSHAQAPKAPQPHLTINLKPAVSQSETAQPASKEELLTTTVLNLKAASQSETAQSAIKEELLTTTVINLKAAASQSETVQAAIKEELLTKTVINLKAAVSQSESAQSALKKELLETTILNLKAAASQSETAQSAIKEELLTATINEMRRQIDELSCALEIERKAREEIVNQQLEASVRQLRAVLEKAWQYGEPKSDEAEEIQKLVRILNISPEVEASITREVKLMMYGKAVKEVIAKRKLLRSSSSTLEWLRKIYQISINEYLEYESHFLMELVTSQFRGTMLFVSPDENLQGEFVPRFKEVGFAVASASSIEDALDKVEKLNPAIVVCDTMSEMGGLSGFKFLHFWRTRPKFETVPFILLCEPFEENQIRASELKNAEGFISKTCEFDEINILVNEKLQYIREYIGSLK
jgi:hypothetical protein